MRPRHRRSTRESAPPTVQHAAAGPALGRPPEFDPDQEPIETVEASPGKVVVSTRQKTGFRLPCRYTLLRHRGRWLLDRKERFHASTGKWVRTTL